ncbi:MAG: queuosine biosynthesis protein [Chloroflexi bacterium 54-19]|nr:MAG: queuosine biosynthesis protein [Chloroflexi bacterium 54-19]
MGRALDFELPPSLEAAEPPEARGLSRDEVRLMVSYLHDNRVVHSAFRQIDQFFEAGDVLVINTSGTLNAALPATRANGQHLELHLSTRLPGDRWTVEVRLPEDGTTRPFREDMAGETLTLPAGATVTLQEPYKPAGNDPARLWLALLDLPEKLEDYLAKNGFPIRYSYVRAQWPSEYYQTVYTTEAGSAEMPSAGRAFTEKVITRLVAKGIQVAPLLLHTGVASLEDHEPPYDEYYRVSQETADLVNRARTTGKRVIAVGTTAIRALETVTDEKGMVHAGEGWTGLVITPERGLHSVNGLLTGFHEPKATHLAMIEALAGLEHLKVTYPEALEQGYLWHEFGDLHLILP